jgi:hypothetical protein
LSILDRILGAKPEIGQPILSEPVLAKRDVEPLEGTDISLFNTIIPTWWAQNGLSLSQQWVPGDGYLAEKVWVSNRCIQLNSQQVASMPLKFVGATEPAWISAPDPHWYPNGIGDAIFAIVKYMYGWGFACGFITDFYADGYPRTWTVLPSPHLEIRQDRDTGDRTYKLGQETLDPRRVFQIDRDPGHRAHGTSALGAYAQQAWGLLAAGNQSMDVSQGGVPKAVLKSQRKLTAEQAEAIQTQWMARVNARNGAPPVLPPELDFETLSFNPSDLALLDTQEWNARSIATAFGVPSTLLNMALQGGLTYQNPGALGEMWWRFELRPMAKRIADALTAQLLPSGQYVWFDATDTYLPLYANRPNEPGPFADDEDDPQAAPQETSAVDPAAPAVAKASPAQQPLPKLTAIGGRP